jgi:hypothetical protein
MRSTAKRAMSSKKFVAFLLASVTWTLLIAVGVKLWMPPDQWSTTVLLGMVVVKGVVEVGYIIGQAGLDALTHLFDVITPDSVFGKAREATSNETNEPTE